MTPLRTRLPATRRPATRRPDARRAGWLSLELALVLPILGLVLFALFEFTLLFLARGELESAGRQGLRVASLPGTTEDDVDAVVRQTLGPRFGPRVAILVEPGERTGDAVAVSLALPMSATAPDLLWPIGWSLRDRNMQAVARGWKE
jgi:hypothetical protein